MSDKQTPNPFQKALGGQEWKTTEVSLEDHLHVTLIVYGVELTSGQFGPAAKITFIDTNTQEVISITTSAVNVLSFARNFKNSDLKFCPIFVTKPRQAYQVELSDQFSYDEIEAALKQLT